MENNDELKNMNECCKKRNPFLLIILLLLLLTIGGLIGWYFGKKTVNKENENNNVIETNKEKDATDATELVVKELVDFYFNDKYYSRLSALNVLGIIPSNDEQKSTYLASNLTDKDKLNIVYDLMDKSELKQINCSDIPNEIESLIINGETIKLSCGMSSDFDEEESYTYSITKEIIDKYYKKVFGSDSKINYVDFNYPCNLIFHYYDDQERYIVYDAIGCGGAGPLYEVSLVNYKLQDENLSVTVKLIGEEEEEIKIYDLIFKKDYTNNWYIYKVDFVS